MLHGLGLKMIKISLIVVQLLFAMLLVYFVVVYPGFPGANQDHPLGYFGWWDQGQYLKQLRDLLSSGVSGLNSGFYPPGYMILALPFAKFLQFFTNSYAEFALIALNTTLVILSVVIFAGRLAGAKAVLFILALSFLIVFSDVVRNALIIPWSSSLTLFVASLFFYIVSSDRIMFKRSSKEIIILIFYGMLLSILLHTRPQDFAIISLSSILYLIFTIYKTSSVGRNVYVAFISFTLVEVVLYLLADGLTFGSVYGTSQHGFLFGDHIDKFLGIISGDQTYGTMSQSLLDRGVVEGTLIVMLILAGIIFGKIEIKVALILWFVIYLAFSDFGPHNFLRYELFHYFKTPLILSLVVFISSFTYSRMLILNVLTFVVLLFHTRINFTDIQYGLEKVSANESIWEVSTNDNVDGLFISGLTTIDALNSGTQNILFVPPSITVNNVKLVPFKEYRVFQGSSGIYIHFFSKQPYHYRLRLDTTKLKVIPNNLPGVYSFHRNVRLK